MATKSYIEETYKKGATLAKSLIVDKMHLADNHVAVHKRKVYDDGTTDLQITITFKAELPKSETVSEGELGAKILRK